MSIYGVEEYLARAKTFIAAGDENSLRHACLEIRLCLERIVYLKLGQIGEQLPPAIFKKWQPPQALRMLLSFEPNADRDKTIEITGHDGVTIQLGSYKMFSIAWLNRHYHKLGNFLHATSLADAAKPSKLTPQAVQAILDEVERVASADVLFTANSISTFVCSACGSDMYASQAQIEAHSTVECPNVNCQNKHLVRAVDQDNYVVEPSNLFIAPCRKCASPMAVEPDEVYLEKACWNCGQVHVFGWGYGELPSAPSDVQAPDQK